MDQQPRKGPATMARGQTSLDFLMTYGWAISLVAIVVGALFALGIFNIGSFLGPRSTGFSQMGVIGWNVDSTGSLSLKLQNLAGMGIRVAVITVTHGTDRFSFNITGVSIPDGKTSGTFTVGTITGLSPGQYYTLPLRIIYSDLSGFNYTDTGTISGNVATGAVAPSIRINSPRNDALLTSRTISIGLTVTGTNLSHTDISVINYTSGDIINSTSNSSIGTYTVQLSVPDDGAYNITAIAYYTSSNRSALARNITVNTTVPAGLQCGDPLDIPDHVYTLTSDVSSADTCFNITADNVTLDCAGHSINGNGSNNGIYNNGNDYVTVKNCIVTGFFNGIDFENGASYGMVVNNTANSNLIGISLSTGSENNTFINNTANDVIGAGINIRSNGNAFFGTSITGGTGGGFYIADANNNTISNSTIANVNYIGMLLDYYGASNNTISNNTIINCGAGIGIDNSRSLSTGNMIYNNFFNNTQNVGTDGLNYWNTTLDCSVPGANIIGGDCIGGNFWATPTGTGWSENSTECHANESGICTWQYNIITNNTDYLPLTNLAPAGLAPTPLSDCGIISYSGNYILTGNVSNESTCFTIEADNVVLDCDGFTINYSDTAEGNAVNVTGFNSAVIENCEIMQTNTSNSAYSDAILLNSSIGSRLYNDTIYTVGTFGISLFDSLGSSLESNTFNSTGNCMRLTNSSDNNVTNNKVYNSGISFESTAGSNDNIIRDNYFESWSQVIYPSSSNGNRFINNTFGGGMPMPMMYDCNNTEFIGNTFTFGASGMFMVMSSDNMTFRDNRMTSSLGGSVFGLMMAMVTNSNISGNNISTSYRGVALSSQCYNNTVADNNLSAGAGEGVGMDAMNANNSITGNLIHSDMGNAVSVGSMCSDNTFSGNWISSASTYQSAISIMSENNTFYDNVITGAYAPIVHIIMPGYNNNSWNTTLTYDPAHPNIIGGNWTGGNFWTGFSDDTSSCIPQSDGTCSSTYAIDSNNIDSHPLTMLPPAIELSDCGNISYSGYYFLSGNVSSGSTCFTLEADNITLNCNGHSLSGSVYGVYNNGYDYVTVKNCIITGFGGGIGFENGANYGFISNNIVNSNGGEGILVQSGSNYNVISNNIADSNGDRGILVQQSSNNNIIINNTVDSNLVGIGLQWSSPSNTVANNTVSNSSQYGIAISWSSSGGNAVYNNFFNNSQNVLSDGSSNSWNTTLDCGAGPNIIGGECVGGNFWAQPDGNGWSENATECDVNYSGICTSNYTIDGSNVDELPLTNLPPTAVDNHVWVANYGSNSVSQIDKATNNVTATITVGSGPVASAIDKDSVWVVNTNNNSTSQINKTTGTVTATITVGAAPYVDAVDQDSIWVTNHDDNTVSRIDKSTNNVTATITVGSGPFGIAVDQDSVWVANFAGTVSRIDKSTNNVTATITVGGFLEGLAVDNDSIWVGNAGGNTVLRIDKSTNNVTATITVGPGPDNTAVDNDSVWVTNFYSGTVSRIDKATNNVTATITVGSQPMGVGVDNSSVWITNQGSNTVSRIDKATNNVTATITVGSIPYSYGDMTGYAYDMFFH